MGAAYTQTGVLAKGRAKGSTGEIEELGREMGLAGACPPPQGGDRHASPLAGDPRGAKGLPRGRDLGCASGSEPRVIVIGF